MKLRNIFLKLTMGTALFTVSLGITTNKSATQAADFSFVNHVMEQADQEECDHSWGKALVTPANTKANGSIEKQCINCGKTENTVISKINKVSLSSKYRTYSGKALKPAVVAKNSSGKTISKKYYTVSYADNKNVGKATVTIKFKGNYSGTVKRTFDIIPSATKISKVAVASEGISVSWNKTVCGDGYEIFRSTNDEEYKKNAIVKTPNITSFTDKRATVNGNKYKYRVVVTGNSGEDVLESAPSKTKGTYYVSRVYVDLNNAPNGVKVSWSSNDKASGYYIYRSSSGQKYKRICTVKGNTVTSYVDKRANVNGKYYKYKVVAYITASNKNYRSLASTERVNYFVERPSITTLNNVLGMKMVIRWSEVSNVTGYQIEYAANSSFNNAFSININDKKNTTKLITNLVKNSNYYVRVRAFKTVKSLMYFSSWSVVKSVKIKSKNTVGSDIQIGNTYLELDLGNQKVYLFKKGKLVYDTECVSGCKAWGMSTPAGVYKINSLERNAKLVGEDYETVVSYWMGFIGNDIGLHDASWRGGFGGDIWKTDGSHGCINLSSQAAKDLYGMVYMGLPVIVYY